MAQRHAVVRNLPAVETLGSVTVVATDKTGTITEGTMLAEVLWVPNGRYDVSGSGYEPVGDITDSGGGTATIDPSVTRLLRDVGLCNDAELRNSDGRWTVVGDPLEGALLAMAEKGGQAREATDRWPRTGRSRSTTTPAG